MSDLTPDETQELRELSRKLAIEMSRDAVAAHNALVRRRRADLWPAAKMKAEITPTVQEQAEADQLRDDFEARYKSSAGLRAELDEATAKP